ncbi:pyridoxamine 5'-phosphate oxidase family protein [Blastochloris viridis]|uniref:General stress protein 26 n=1 Tax=Blastochloris viridis TaxID=1079 RepID=A0A0H5BDK9_BLAVI|nr:pyridoxamine 5'-phosphate oxidase family protein [Blastochloris viridis]ALK08324.1 General stress protein 26 [Blastochloris viridis]BAR98406.1 hypothetical protein BV133_813 [Blastochloris viridis]CUU44246.1 General stress protein 26 [Blastochloris viridis]
MNRAFKDAIVKLLGEHRVLTLATVRPDGWPHATLVGFCNDGLALYMFVSRDSQKVRNIRHEPRVSAAVGSDTRRPLDIKGLSLAGRAVVVEDRSEIEHARTLYLQRYPEYRVLPAPNPAEIAMLRLVPDVVSVTDYSKGFGHADLVSVSADDVEEIVDQHRRHWAG